MKVSSGPIEARPGLSLAELMLILLIGLVVGAVALSVYQIDSRYYLQRDALSEQSQNLKVALNSLARDVRMSGNIHKALGWEVRNIQVFIACSGRGHWFRHPGAAESGVRPIFGLDGGPDAPDEITLFSAEMESAAPVGRLAAGYEPSGPAGLGLSLSGSGPKVEAGDILALKNGGAVLILEAAAVEDGGRIVIGPKFKPLDDLPEGIDFPAGTFVYNLKSLNFVTYYINGADHSLMVQYHDGRLPDCDGRERQSLLAASTIEDLQIRYVFDDGSLPSPSSGLDGFKASLLDEYPVKLVNLVLVSKSSFRGPANETARIPAVFNRRTRPGDEHQRQIMNESIFIR